MYYQIVISLSGEAAGSPKQFQPLLAVIYIDGSNFCEELIRKGLSPYYTKYGKSAKYHDAFRNAEKAARDEKLGIWSDVGLTEKYLRLKSKWGMGAEFKEP